MEVSLSPTAVAVLRHLVSAGTVTKPALQQLLGVSDATAFRSVEELSALGIIDHKAPQAPSRGRPPILLGINNCSFASIAVTIEDEETNLSVVDAGGDIIYQATPRVNAKTDYEQAIKVLSSEILAARRAAMAQTSLLSGVGLALDGSVNPLTGALLQPSRFPLWHHRQLGPDLSLSTGLRCAVDNGVSSLTRMLLWYGTSANLDNFVLVNCSRGIGLGISLHGAVLQGLGNLPAGLAHTSTAATTAGRKQCFCGRNDCLELHHSLIAVREDCAASPNLTNTEFIALAERDDRIANRLQNAAIALSANAMELARCLDVNLIVATGPMTHSAAFREAFTGNIDADRKNRRGYQRAVFLDEVVAHPLPTALAAAAISLDQVFHQRSFLRV